MSLPGDTVPWSRALYAVSSVGATTTALANVFGGAIVAKFPIGEVVVPASFVPLIRK